MIGRTAMAEQSVARGNKKGVRFVRENQFELGGAGDNVTPQSGTECSRLAMLGPSAMPPAFVHPVMSAVPDVGVVMAVTTTEAVLHPRAAMMMMAVPVTMTMADGLNFTRWNSVAMTVMFTCRCGGGRQAGGKCQGGRCKNGEKRTRGGDFHFRLGVEVRF